MQLIKYETAPEPSGAVFPFIFRAAAARSLSGSEKVATTGVSG